MPNEEFELLKLKIEQLKEAEKVKEKKKLLNLEFLIDDLTGLFVSLGFHSKDLILK